MKEPFLSHYRNSEFLQYIKDVLELMNRYDASVLGLTEQRDALVAIIVTLDAAFQLDQRNEFTQVLLDLDTKRGNVYRGIKSILEGNTLHFSLTKQEAAKRLLFNLTSYGKDVIRMNYQAETAILDSMLADWNTDLTLQEAVVTLQLSEWVTELQRINIVFNERYLASVSETSANPPQSFSALR